jgi:hypothetical protein
MSCTNDAIAEICDLDRLARLSIPAIDDIARKDPGMPGGDAVRRLTIDLNDAH